MSPSIGIRAAAATDIESTVVIEAAADVLLVERFGAIDWPPPASAEERLRSPGFILLAETDAPDVGTMPIGFVQVLEIEGVAHLEQLSVLPAHGGRGVGRRLVGAALEESARRGYARITLRTYAEVPWNAPFYASCGFAVTEPATDFHRSLVDVEHRLGLDSHGVRVQMTAELDNNWRDSYAQRL